ncbi:MAG: GNAT family N-acetyltransferase [Devosia sp.]
MRLRHALPEQIETERLLLRAPHVSDLDDLVREANNWKVLEPTASLPYPYRDEHGRGFIERFAHKPDKRSYVIAGRDDDRLKGVIGLYFHADKPVELGYWLGETHWGFGYAPEAVKALLGAAAAIGLKPIRARVLSANPGSVRVLEKTGFATIERTQSVVERHLGKPLLVMEWPG